MKVRKYVKVEGNLYQVADRRSVEAFVDLAKLEKTVPNNADLMKMGINSLDLIDMLEAATNSSMDFLFAQLREKGIIEKEMTHSSITKRYSIAVDAALDIAAKAAIKKDREQRK